MSEETYTALYGDAAGRWLLLEGPVGLLAPPVLLGHIPGVGAVELPDLGTPSDVVCRIHNHHAGHKTPVQATLAALMGVTQQQVSRYANGDSQPGRANYPLLARLAHDPDALIISRSTP